MMIKQELILAFGRLDVTPLKWKFETFAIGNFLCTMLVLCCYKICTKGTKGNFGCNYDILD